MAEDPEKSLNKALDKLFHAPRTRQLPYPSSAAKKRTRTSTVLGSRSSILGGNHEVVVRDSGRHPSAPLCRPWERQDLMKRLATFKSMTWFAKPKVISPVNCARRGWVNVEMDIITFEKAAAVFSLKLDSGHKLLCPWIDNACDEKLALFPPTAVPALVEGYQERFSSILKISALPIISSSATDYMRSPQLESFLAEPMQSVYSLDDGIRLSNIPRSKELDNASESTTEILYYQALKIISLCGWEPRFLPYTVDCDDCSVSSAKDASHSKPSAQTCTQQNSSTATTSHEMEEIKDGQPTCHKYQYDPASVVLDCNLCGASVGLWAFSTVRQPLESFTLIESPEANSQDKSVSYNLNTLNRLGEAPRPNSMGEEDPGSSRSITDISCNFATSQENTKISQHEKHTTESALIVWSEGAGSKRKRMENELCDSEGSHSDDHANINGEAIAVEGTPEHKESSKEISSEGRCHAEQEIALLNTGATGHDVGVEHLEEFMESELQILKGGFSSFIGDENAGSIVEEIATESNDRECLSATTGNDIPLRNGESCEERSLIVSSDTGNHHDKGLSANASLRNNDADLGKAGRCFDILIYTEPQASNQEVDEMHTIIPSCIVSDTHTQEKDSKKMGFDPIKQHRPFCPWIASMDGAHMPGWKQLLNALTAKGNDSLLLARRVPAAILSSDEVDDPIVSIRKLFSSPVTKRLNIDT
ncbi:hypothetical protein QJS04_geneDACA002885 [Acorus gramineus]|uniref:C3HC-type domain-containing protein n=1 Tax=Acorus gramineus TaxID=55184 RepID=A0AAV9BU24_ACOGR|nr:hypothetical protein QJS04_geneDACA002885 [Acorus gramineus]